MVRALRCIFSAISRSEEHTSELQSPGDLVCRLLLENNSIGENGVAFGRSRVVVDLDVSSVAIHEADVDHRIFVGHIFFAFYFIVPGTPEMYSLSLHQPLPI